MADVTDYLDSAGKLTTGVLDALSGRSKPAPGTPAAAPRAKPDYMPWLIGGGAALALIVLLFVLGRKT